MKNKLHIYELLVILISVYSTFIFVYKLINPIFPATRILGLLAFIISGVIILNHLKTKDVLIVFTIVLMFILSFLTSEDIKTNLSDATYWLSTLLFLWMIQIEQISNKIFHAFNKSKQLIINIIILNNLILILELFNSACYDSSWGGSYFLGFAYSNHVLASGACLHLCLTLLYSHNIKKDIVKILLMIPGTLAILQSGARVYLISIMILWFLMYFYCMNNKSIKIITFPAAIIAACYLFIHSGMMDKFLNPNTYATSGGLDLFTSGRSIFWVIDLEKFWKLNILNQLVGKGFDFPYYVNETYYSMRIWSHNDFIDSLLSVGILGLFLYIFVVFKNIQALKCKKLIILIIGMYYIFVAFVNGLFVYQHYVFSYIILYCFAVYRIRKEIKNSENNSVS